MKEKLLKNGKLNLMFFLFLMASISGIAQQHTVTSFSPSYAGTGDVVTIVGTNFSSITGVKFGGTTATSYTVVSSTKITAIVAAGTTGSITVTKSGVVTPNVAITGFTYSTLPTVTRIITDFGSFWDTNTTTTNPIFPDNSHNLMAFSYAGTTYSTGVNDAGLTSRGVSFTPGVFKALPAVLTGTTGTSASLYIAAGKKLDGNANSGIYTNNNVKNLTLQNVLTDGINGLNLGTGYTNLPSTATSNYTVLSINPAKISDSEPDILVTQIADPTGTATDTYKFVNSVGATVGNSLSISLAALSKLGTYSLDLFAVATNTSFSLAKPTSTFGANTTRDIRFVGFKLSDFGIDAGNYASVVSLQVTPSGVSDSAFMGYNANSINVPPSIAINTTATNSVVCTSGGGNAFLSVYGVSIGGGSLTYSWEVSTNGGSSWSTVTNNGTYSGATTSGLTITAATSGNLYRATVTEVSSGLTATSSNFTITSILSSALAGTLNPTALNLCLNSIATVTSLSVAPTGGAGTYSYQWSTSTSAGGTYTDITGAIFSSYSPDISVHGTKYYKVKITSGCTSNTPTATAVTISGDDILTFANGVTCTTGAVTLGATNVTGTASNINWYTVITAGTSQGTGISYNTPSISATTTYYVGTVFEGCSSTRQAVTATVANTITLTSANFSIPNTTSICPGTGSVVSVSTSGLVDGTYTANYTVSGSNSLTSTASLVISGGFGTFTTGNLANSGSNTITITGIVMSGCTITPASGNTATITVTTGSIPGSISGAATVCTGTNSTTLTLSGYTGSIQWQSSPNNGTFTSIIGENSSTYTATDLGATTYYRANVVNGACAAANSSSATVTVNPLSVSGSISGATTVCTGINSTLLSLSGNTGSIQWQSSNDNISYSPIGGATSSTYNVSNLSSATYYKAVVTSGVCSSATSDYALMNVSAPSVSGNISGAASVCTGTNSTMLTLSGYTGTIQWQSSLNNSSFSNISGATASTYTATDLSATTYYRAVVTNGACSSATTTSAALTVNSLSIGGTVSGSTTVFAGTNSSTLTLSGYTGSIQWQSSTNNVTFSNISAATSTTYTATNLSATTYYRAVLTSGVCSADISDIATVTTLQLVPGAIAGGTTVCTGVNSTLLTLSGQVGNIVRWQRSSVSDFSSNVTNISNTSTSLTATNVSTTTYYRAEISGGGLTVYSSTAMIYINSVALVLEPISGPINLCGMTSATYTVPAIPTGSTNYIWTLPAGLSVYTSIGNELVVNVDPLFESGYISVKAVNNCGVSNIVSIFVSKTPYLTTITGLSSVCGATTATYSTTSISGATYAWTVPNLMTITSGQGTSSITVSIGGGYTSGVVRVQATSSCGISDNKRFPVYSAIIPTTINGPGHVCGLSTATFSTPSISGATFVWSVTSGMTIVSGQGTTSIVVSFSGGFVQGTIGVAATTSCGTSVEQTLPIATTRTPKTITGPKVLCGMYRNTYDESGNLLNSTPGQGIYSIVPFPGVTSYTWSVPAGATIASGQGTSTVVVNFDLTNFINGDISVVANTSCGTSPSSSITVVRLGGEITGPAQICSLTSATYSVPTTIGTGFNWTVPASIMTITSGQGTNTITVDINTTSICTIDSVVRVAFTSNCSTSETVSLNVRCSDFTKVRADQCGTTLASINSIIYTDNPGNSAVSMYKMRITDGIITKYVESPNGKFYLTGIPNFDWQFGVTYTVDIALKIDGTYKEYGCACTITMPSIPTTQIQSSQCNTTVATPETLIWADWIDGSTHYKFRINDGTTTQYIIRPSRNFMMWSFAWAYNKTYTIDVAIKRGTGSFGDYGPSCTISSPSSIAKHIELNNNNSLWEVNFDENPFDTFFNLNINSSSTSLIQVVIFDVTGKQLENKKINPDEIINTHFGENLSSGVYFVNVSQGLNTKTLKMMKR
jgi:hypothetical protein